jgi:hypothetical protein
MELLDHPAGRVDRYLGFLFARAGTPEEVEGVLRRCTANLRSSSLV